MNQVDLDARGREGLLYTLANICATVMRDKRGVVGDVARAIGGYVVAPPIDPVYIRRYFGDEKVRGSGRASQDSHRRGSCTRSSDGRRSRACNTVRKPPQCQRAFSRGLEKNQRRGKTTEMLVIQKSSAHEIPNLRVSPLVGEVTHKVRIIPYLSFDEQRRGRKGGLNGDTDADTVPHRLYAHALPKYS